MRTLARSRKKNAAELIVGSMGGWWMSTSLVPVVTYGMNPIWFRRRTRNFVDDTTRIVMIRVVIIVWHAMYHKVEIESTTVITMQFEYNTTSIESGANIILYVETVERLNS